MGESTGIWKDVVLQSWRESTAVMLMQACLQQGDLDNPPPPNQLAGYVVRCVDELAKRLGHPVVP